MLLKGTGCRILDPQRALSQRLVPSKEIIPNRPHGQMAPRNTLQRTCTQPRPIPTTGGMTETKRAKLSINYEILTAGKTRTLAAILIGILMLAGTLTKIPKLALILTGILMLAGMLARIPTLARTFTRISIPAATLTSEAIEISDRTERQSRADLNGYKPNPDKNPNPDSTRRPSGGFEIWGETERQSRAEHKTL